MEHVSLQDMVETALAEKFGSAETSLQPMHLKRGAGLLQLRLREVVVKVLKSADGPLAPREIHRLVQEEDVRLAGVPYLSVYRAIRETPSICSSGAGRYTLVREDVGIARFPLAQRFWGSAGLEALNSSSGLDGDEMSTPE